MVQHHHLHGTGYRVLEPQAGRVYVQTMPGLRRLNVPTGIVVLDRTRKVLYDSNVLPGDKGNRPSCWCCAKKVSDLPSSRNAHCLFGRFRHAKFSRGHTYSRLVAVAADYKSGDQQIDGTFIAVLGRPVDDDLDMGPDRQRLSAAKTDAAAAHVERESRASSSNSTFLRHVVAQRKS